MRRRTAWRAIWQGGVGTSGWMAAFLLGMAAAMFLKLMSAGGGCRNPALRIQNPTGFRRSWRRKLRKPAAANWQEDRGCRNPEAAI